MRSVSSLVAASLACFPLVAFFDAFPFAFAFAPFLAATETSSSLSSSWSSSFIPPSRAALASRSSWMSSLRVLMGNSFKCFDSFASTASLVASLAALFAAALALGALAALEALAGEAFASRFRFCALFVVLSAICDTRFARTLESSPAPRGCAKPGAPGEKGICAPHLEALHP